MEQILKNLQDPSWWFTGVFFILVGILLTKLIFDWLPKLFLRIYKYIPDVLRRISRANERRVLLQIKNYRQRDMKVVWLIGRYWTLTVLAISAFLTYAFFYSLSQPINIGNLFSIDRTVVLIPLYLIMLYVVRERRILERIIKAHHQWQRISSRR